MKWRLIVLLGSPHINHEDMETVLPLPFPPHTRNVLPTCQLANLTLFSAVRCRSQQHTLDTAYVRSLHLILRYSRIAVGRCRHHPIDRYSGANAHRGHPPTCGAMWFIVRYHGYGVFILITAGPFTTLDRKRHALAIVNGHRLNDAHEPPATVISCLHHPSSLLVAVAVSTLAVSVVSLSGSSVGLIRLIKASTSLGTPWSTYGRPLFLSM